MMSRVRVSAFALLNTDVYNTGLCLHRHVYIKLTLGDLPQSPPGQPSADTIITSLIILMLIKYNYAWTFSIKNDAAPLIKFIRVPGIVFPTAPTRCILFRGQIKLTKSGLIQRLRCIMPSLSRESMKILWITSSDLFRLLALIRSEEGFRSVIYLDSSLPSDIRLSLQIIIAACVHIMQCNLKQTENKLHSHGRARI